MSYFSCPCSLEIVKIQFSFNNNFLSRKHKVFVTFKLKTLMLDIACCSKMKYNSNWLFHTLDCHNVERECSFPSLFNQKVFKNKFFILFYITNVSLECQALSAILIMHICAQKAFFFIYWCEGWASLSKIRIVWKSKFRFNFTYIHSLSSIRICWRKNIHFCKNSDNMLLSNELMQFIKCIEYDTMNDEPTVVSRCVFRLFLTFPMF